IAHNKALDSHRARARGAIPVAEPAAVDRRTEPSPVARDETLWEAVEELPDRQRSAVMLRYVADLPHRDIAAAIGCSEEAARRSLHEGLTKHRKAGPAGTRISRPRSTRWSPRRFAAAPGQAPEQAQARPAPWVVMRRPTSNAPPPVQPAAWPIAPPPKVSPM